MPNIVLTRIDNRLIHGQVAVTWVQHVGANLILVANDDVARDPLQQSLMDMAVPTGIETRYFTIEETIKKIGLASARQRIAIILKTPQDALRLVEGGVPIRHVNIGNMHFSEGKQQISSTVAVDENDKEAFRALHAKGVKLEIRRVPHERAVDIMELI